MKKIYLIRWHNSFEYYNGQGFYKYNTNNGKFNTREYDTIESAEKDILRLATTYYRYPIIIESAYKSVNAEPTA